MAKKTKRKSKESCDQGIEYNGSNWDKPMKFYPTQDYTENWERIFGKCTNSKSQKKEAK